MKGPKFVPKCGPKRPRRQRERDLELIARWWLEGRTEREIEALLNAGRKIHVSDTAVHQDLAKVRERWRESALESIAERKATDLAKLDNIETTAWRSWQATTDPQLLSILLKCLERRARMLGLDAPARTQLTGERYGTVTIEGSPESGNGVEIILPYNGRDLYPVEPSEQTMG